ncbi:MAG: VTT domain-containing protein [Hadesarchaea archaeon]|nr:VTT domain-containing protein [Hadesarchaea archaeon]
MMKRWFSCRKKAVTTALIIVVVLAVVILFAMLAIAIPKISEDVWKNIGYPGISLLSFIGASSVIIPIPYTVILFGIAPAFNPFLLAIAAGLGAAGGELVGYGLGYAGRHVVGKKRRRQLDAMLSIFERFGVLAVFIFALTPLPDDLLFIPLGLMHYSLWRAFTACVAGKFAMSFIIAYMGKAAGELFDGWMLAAVVAVILVLVMVVMFRIDWVKVAERYVPRKRKK